MRYLVHAGMILMLTVLTGLGGIVWVLALGWRRLRNGRGMWGLLAAFSLGYALFWGGAQIAAPLAGRVPLPCAGELLRMQSLFYCVTLRNFVAPELRDVARDTALTIARDYPGTVTLALDGGFPIGGLPMWPHLSHGDGEKLDLAFFYADAQGEYLPGQTASPLGYFAFEALEGPQVCPETRTTRMWRMGWFQPFVRDLALEPARTAAAVRLLLEDPRVDKVFVEPPLADRLGVSGPKLRFQGCNAARHDDHIHLQL